MQEAKDGTFDDPERVNAGRDLKTPPFACVLRRLTSQIKPVY